MQKNIDKIQSNLAELEARLKHEQAKFKNYNVDMQEAETRCVCWLPFPVCAPSWGCRYCMHRPVILHHHSIWACHSPQSYKHWTIFEHG